MHKESIGKKQAAYNALHKESIGKETSSIQCLPHKERLAKKKTEYNTLNKEIIAKKQATNHASKNKIKATMQAAYYLLKIMKMQNGSSAKKELQLHNQNIQPSIRKLREESIQR